MEHTKSRALRSPARSSAFLVHVCLPTKVAYSLLQTGLPMCSNMVKRNDRFRVIRRQILYSSTERAIHGRTITIINFYFKARKNNRKLYTIELPVWPSHFFLRIHFTASYNLFSFQVFTAGHVVLVLSWGLILMRSHYLESKPSRYRANAWFDAPKGSHFSLFVWFNDRELVRGEVALLLLEVSPIAKAVVFPVATVAERPLRPPMEDDAYS